MSIYFFVLGNSTSLAEAELQHVLLRNKIAFTVVFKQFPVVAIETDLPVETTNLMRQLGGTVKIARLLGEIENIQPEAIASLISTSGQPLTFGISFFGNYLGSIPKLHKDLKDILHTTSKSVRFVLPKDKVISSVLFTKQKIREFILIESKKGWLFGEVESAQNVDDWSKRDYGRPNADPKSGMLPPKVALMLVNLAKTEAADFTIYDPFCGMGTILGEALLIGCHTIGSDIKQAVVKQATENIEWIKKEYPHTSNQKSLFFTSDATHTPESVPSNSVDAVVTEPFMGSPFEIKGDVVYQRNKPVTKQAVVDTLKGLEKLYRGALKNWKLILKPKGIVVMIVPSISFAGKQYSVKNLIDNCEILGYTLTEGPYTYSRPQAIVKRNIYVFTKSNIKNQR